jgi:hypothetical protein
MYPIIMIILKDLLILLSIPFVTGVISSAIPEKERFLQGINAILTAE